MARLSIGITQRDVNGSNASLVFRNFADSPDRYSAQFEAQLVDRSRNPVGTPVTGLVHGSAFELPLGDVREVLVTQTTGDDAGSTTYVTLQVYQLVFGEYAIFHFFHEEHGEAVWGIGCALTDFDTIYVFRSADYFQSVPGPHSNTEIRGSFTASGDNANPNSLSGNGRAPTMYNGPYRSIYVDRYGNVIVTWRPQPMISRDGGATFEQLGFSWHMPSDGEICPFWNITENDSGTMVISEYGTAPNDGTGTDNSMSDCGTYWSSDATRSSWTTRLVGPGFDSGDDSKFSGYFRHLHGYHIHPDLPLIHHLFVGDAPDGHPNEGPTGYYVSQDGGSTWSTEIIRQWPQFSGNFYNGPCFVTWWPNGKAFVVSDHPEHGGDAYSWGSGPNDWGGPGFDPAIELHGDVDDEMNEYETPWMAMAVKGSYETYCSTSADKPDSKEVVWRYDADTKAIRVIAEIYMADIGSGNTNYDVSTLRWLSGSRHNRIPAQARYFFTSGNRRFCRSAIQPEVRPFVDGNYKVICAASKKALTIPNGSTSAGTGAVQMPYTGADDQKWILTYRGGGYYTLSPLHNGNMVLDVEGGLVDDGLTLIQWPLHGRSNQLWQFVAEDGGTYRMLSNKSGKVADVRGGSLDDGAPLIQWLWHDGGNQKWLITPV